MSEEVVESPGTAEEHAQQRNATGGGSSADLNSRDEITHRILRDCNPTLTMIPGTWPPVPPLSDQQKGTTSSGESTDQDPVPTPTTHVPSTPVLPSVDCTLRKRQRVEKALQHDEDSADTILQDAKRAYYESGTMNQVQLL